MNDKILLEIENKISNNEHAKVIEILNIHFKKNGYKPLFLSYYIDCLIKLGLRDLACKNFELMMRMFPDFYRPKQLILLYLDLNMVDKVEQLLLIHKFNSRDLYRIAKKCYLNNIHDLAEKLFRELLKTEKSELGTKRIKEYLRRIDIYKNDKDVFVETSYPCFKAEGHTLEPRHIIYVNKIRDDHFENQYNEDPKRETRPYLIWKIENDKIYCFGITTQTSKQDYTHQHYVLYSQNYKTRNFDRIVKNNLTVIDERDVETVIDRVTDKDFEIVIDNIYRDICFQHDILKKHNAYFIETVSSQFQPKLYDVIQVPFQDEKGNRLRKSYLILGVDKKERYIVLEVSLKAEEIQIVNYNLSFMRQKSPILSIVDIDSERKNSLMEKVPSNFKNVNMIGAIVECDNKKLEILMEQDGLYICIDRTFYASCSYISVEFIDKNDPLYILKRVPSQEVKKHIQLLKDYMKSHSTEIYRRKQEYTLSRRLNNSNRKNINNL